MSLRIARAAGIFAVALIAASPPAVSAAPLKIGDTPQLTYTSVTDRQTVRLEDYRGRIVIVDFWATWCPPCMAEAAHMVRINQEYAPRGLQILGVSRDKQLDKLKQVARQKNFDWPQMFGDDATHNLVVDWGGAGIGIPWCVILDPDGRVAWMGHSAVMDQPLADVFAKTPPRQASPEAREWAERFLERADIALGIDSVGDAALALLEIPEEAASDWKLAPRVDRTRRRLKDRTDRAVKDLEEQLRREQDVPAAEALLRLGFDSDKAVEAAAHPGLALIHRTLQKSPQVRQAAARAQQEKSAARNLKDAQLLRSQGKHQPAYRALRLVATSFPDTDAGRQAVDLVAQYEGDASFMTALRDSETSEKARALLSVARSYRSAGKADLARQKYRALIAQFPDTPFAAAAKVELADLD